LATEQHRRPLDPEAGSWQFQNRLTSNSKKPPACDGKLGVLLLVARAGIEPATFHFSGGRSYRLSYLASRTGRSHSRGSGPRSDPDGT
jgi:hypothetical protein